MAFNFDSLIYKSPLSKCQYGELRNPMLMDLEAKISEQQRRLGTYAHEVGRLNTIDVSNISMFRIGFGKMFVSAIEDIKHIHLETLDLINQAIEILSK